jgi:ribosome-binding protein aMBF1 (putative translation factor)
MRKPKQPSRLVGELLETADDMRRVGLMDAATHRMITIRHGARRRPHVEVPRTIAAGKLFREWRKHPRYVAAYNSLDDAFALAATIIKARTDAGFTQQELAKRMRTTQVLIAKLESGRVKPSIRMLQRLAAATGTRLRISFEAESL